MKLGFTTNKSSKEKLLPLCDEVVVIDLAEQTAKSFYEFVKKNSDHALYIYELADVGLQLVQIAKVVELLDSQKKVIHFIDKGPLNQLDDVMYFKLLKSLVENEQNIMTFKLRKGINKAREKGVNWGRPTVSRLIIEEIQFLHRSQKLTIREIAKLCNVSIGTAHKYASQVREE